jgi:DNA-binding Lrp family transcriptional regulator
MKPEEYEPIIREIMELEDRIRKREERIKELEERMAKRREETGLSHRELYRIDPEYRGWANSIRSLRGWNTFDRKRIEELRKLLPPLRALYQIMTFSIETGRGHEGFFAEITCDTVISYETSRSERRRIMQRALNACLKYFFIMFDSQKCVNKYLAYEQGASVYSSLKSVVDRFWNVYSINIRVFTEEEAEKVSEYRELLAKHPYVIREEEMDEFIRRVREYGCFKRPLDEFVTRESVIKIGVEYQFAPIDAEPKYPLIYVLVEKGKEKKTVIEKKSDWILMAKIKVADKTDIDLTDILKMRCEFE